MAGKETIAALATAPGKGALACIRVSGPRAVGIVTQCLENPAKFEKSRLRSICLYRFHSPKERKEIDEITAIRYAAPDSFTGEDMVEIVCHGGTHIVRKILVSLYRAGAVAAGRGEFTRRAHENGKIGLMKAEAIYGLIESTNEAELMCAQKLYKENNKALDKWREALIGILSKVEAWIEFDEEDAVVNLKKEAENTLSKFLKILKKDIEKREKIKKLEKGIKVVIAGPVNAGKSTLFNELVGYKRVIVHHEPGTTRDMVSESLLIDSHEILLVDTAGIRETENEIEKEGINRTKEAISTAGILIWVSSAEEPVQKGETEELLSNKDKQVIVIINKSDICSTKEKKDIFKKAGIHAISASLKQDKRTDVIFEQFRKNVEMASEKIETPELLLNRRHEAIGRKIFTEIKRAQEKWDNIEIAAEHIKRGISFLDEIYGKMNSEDILNAIFEKFCIGK